MTCLSPLDAALLADYWLGALPLTEEEAVEQHLFACDECGARMRDTGSLAEALHDLARQGSLTMVASEAFLDRVAQQGLRVREYAVQAGRSVECTVAAEDDFLIGRLTADLTGAKRFDLSICDAGGAEQMRLADIPFDPKAGNVAFQQSITYAKAAPSGTMIARLVAVDDTGSERLVGNYTFNHTRTIPGPAAW